MTSAVKTHKNLDDFHAWPARYRHWNLEIAEDHEHHLWVCTRDLREIYPYLLPDSTLVQQYRSAMFYVKSRRCYYISGRSMKLALHKGRTGHDEALKFIDWFDRHLGAAAAKKAAYAHHDRVNEVRDEHSATVKVGPLPAGSGSQHLDAATIPDDGRQAWTRQRNAGEPEKVFRVEALPVRTTWGQFAREKLRQAGNYLKAVWKGEKSLFITLVVGLAIGLIPGKFDELFVPDDLDLTRDYLRLYWGQALYLLLSIPAAGWFAITLWRSAWRSLSLPGGKLWATAVFFSFIPLTTDIALSRFDLDIFEHWYDTLRGKSQPAEVWADPVLGRIVIHGSLRFGSAQALEKVLQANPRMTLLQIESPGGRVVEGMRMARIVMQHKLDTVTMGKCASACTFILQAGQDRYLGPEAHVGFHRSGRRYGPVSSGMSHTDYYIAAYYRQRGASPDFVRKAMTPSITSIWVPTHAEMLTAGYATAPWSERKPGY